MFRTATSFALEERKEKNLSDLLGKLRPMSKKAQIRNKSGMEKVSFCAPFISDEDWKQHRLPFHMEHLTTSTLDSNWNEEILENDNMFGHEEMRVKQSYRPEISSVDDVSSIGPYDKLEANKQKLSYQTRVGFPLSCRKWTAPDSDSCFNLHQNQPAMEEQSAPIEKEFDMDEALRNEMFDLYVVSGSQQMDNTPCNVVNVQPILGSVSRRESRSSGRSSEERICEQAKSIIARVRIFFNAYGKDIESYDLHLSRYNEIALPRANVYMRRLLKDHPSPTEFLRRLVRGRFELFNDPDKWTSRATGINIDTVRQCVDPVPNASCIAGGKLVERRRRRRTVASDRPTSIRGTTTSRRNEGDETDNAARKRTRTKRKALRKFDKVDANGY
ncbi:hypothetical protein RB195_010289 [Necator americanus]|uniref:Uncharacterized protein n=1 Tax=Necator americanus TaxID=51031 RepID=A0ABR1CXB2_NECAM